VYYLRQITGRGEPEGIGRVNIKGKIAIVIATDALSVFYKNNIGERQGCFGLNIYHLALYKKFAGGIIVVELGRGDDRHKTQDARQYHF